MNDHPDEILPRRAIWWRAASVAPSLGMSVDVMLAAIAAGQLKIRAEQFGNRGLIFVNSNDVLAYIENLKETA